MGPSVPISEFTSKAALSNTATECYVVAIKSGPMQDSNGKTYDSMFETVDMFNKGNPQTDYNTIPNIPTRKVTVGNNCQWLYGNNWGDKVNVF